MPDLKIARQDLATSLHIIRRGICAYGGSGICDCKFGVTKFGSVQRGELGCGCPEVRTAYDIVMSLTDAEYARILKRPAAENLAKKRLKPVWCVKWKREDKKEMWCATFRGHAPSKDAVHDATACGYTVTFRIGSEKRVPTCRDCIQRLIRRRKSSTS